MKILLLLVSLVAINAQELRRTAFVFYARPTTWDTNEISFNVRRYDSGDITNQLGYTLVTNVPLNNPYKLIIEFPVDQTKLYAITKTNRLTGIESVENIAPIQRVTQR